MNVIVPIQFGTRDLKKALWQKQSDYKPEIF